IRPGESTQVPTAERVAIGFSQVRDFLDGKASSDVSLLELRLTASGPNARLVTFRQVWLTLAGETRPELGPVQLGQDPFSVQLHVRDQTDETDAALLRFDTLGDLYLQIKTAPMLPFAGHGRVVQLDNQSAMVHVGDADLLAVPLFDV